MLKKIAVILIQIYQKLVFFKPRTCRFEPTCSEYTKLAILEWGFFKGCWLGIIRISKCHPFHPGGLDPVPLKEETQT
jgi:putative membrane protein insertion efficiency factor